MGKRVLEDGIVQVDGLYWVFARPEVLLGTHLGVIAGLWTWAAIREAHAHGSLLGVPIAAAWGWALWTLFEYAFHRWCLHHKRRPFLRRIFWEALHREHHGFRRMDDPDHHGVNIAITLPVVALLAAPTIALTRSGRPLAALGGFLLGYAQYEALHWLFHTPSLLPRFRRWRTVAGLDVAHTIHHLDSANKNYGFVTVFWDRVFRTFVAERRARRTA